MWRVTKKSSGHRRGRRAWLGTGTLERAVIKFASATGVVEVFSFCYASQNPIMVCFQRLEDSELGLPTMSTAMHNHEPWAFWAHRFGLMDEFCYTDDAAFQGDFVVSVLLDCRKMGQQQVVSDSERQPLAELCKHFPRCAGEALVEPPTRGESAPGGQQVGWLAHPWLLDHWAGKGMQPYVEMALVKEAVPEIASEREEAEALLDEWNVGDEAALHEKRLELADGSGCEGADFHWGPRGGKRTKQAKGVIYDCVACYPRSSEVRDWCKEMGINQQASFATSRHGEDGACKLTSWWASSAVLEGLRLRRQRAARVV